MRARLPIPVLGRDLVFPDPRNAPGDRPLAIGGDLSVERLALAYRMGIFPWSVNPITWWSPDPRTVLELSDLHVSRSLRKTLRQGRFRVTFDSDFRAVVEACAAPAAGREDTWIKPEFIEAYSRLHRAGLAHSVECWMDNELVGGVYGVALGGFFAGESMFHRVADASKVALVALVDRLRENRFELFDTQMATPLTRGFGAIDLRRSIYLHRLTAAIGLPLRF